MLNIKTLGLDLEMISNYTLEFVGNLDFYSKYWLRTLWLKYKPQVPVFLRFIFQ